MLGFYLKLPTDQSRETKALKGSICFALTEDQNPRSCWSVAGSPSVHVWWILPASLGFKHMLVDELASLIYPGV